MKKIFSVVITLVCLGLVLKIPFVRSLLLSVFDLALVIAMGIATIGSLKYGRLILGLVLGLITIALFKNIPFMFAKFW